MNRLLETLEDRRLMSVSASPFMLGHITHTVAPATSVAMAPGQAVAVNAEAGQEFTAVVATLGKKTVKDVSQLSGTIDWGDGSDSSEATFVRANGRIQVLGTHTYAAVGHFDVKVTLYRRPFVPPGQPNMFLPIRLGEISTDATVVTRKLGGVSLTESAGQSFTDRIGSFNFPNVDLILTATINWGDGHTSSGEVQNVDGLQSGNYDVIGTHTYANVGHYKVKVTIQSHLPGSQLPGGTITSFNSDVTVKGRA